MTCTFQPGEIVGMVTTIIWAHKHDWDNIWLKNYVTLDGKLYQNMNTNDDWK